MASTYSNLKIQLMATGENASTWGDVTNTNLGTAIEEAIAGSADVTFASGPVTLTLSDTNGTQPARNMRLNLVGTTGGATRNLVVPSIEKAYIVNNTCEDSVVVKTAAGTGITVPAGKTMWVYNNGTNVVDAVTHLTSLTLGSPLPVSSGGTGSNTGSGASLSNLNASNVSSGTLAVTYGGTGGTTAATARVNLLPSYTGNAGKLLALNAGGTDTEWVSAGGAGTVTSVNATTAISGLSFSGGPVTSAGTLTLSGTLGVQGGGTGITGIATNGQLLIGNGSGYTLNTLTAGSGITITNSSGGITIAASGGGGSGTVTSVSGTGSVNGITLSGTVTSSGSLTLGGSLSGVSLTSQVSGTLPAANGGTGLTTPGTAGNVLTSNGSGWVSQAPSAGGGTVSLNDGSATSPSLNFSADTNTGIYRVGSDQLGISAGGSNQVTISTSAVTTTVAVVAPTGLGASTPAYTFSGDTSTGLAYQGAGSMRFVNSGVATLGFSSSLINMLVPMRLPSYTTTTLPSASTAAGQMIYVSNESGGAVPAFSDGTNWRRVTDRAIVS